MAKDKKINKGFQKKSQSNVKEKKSSDKNISHQAPNSSTSGIWQDERFQHLVSDPRFKNLSKDHRKVKIDKRFQSMFTDDKFKVKYTVDKYGRRVNKSNAEDLKKYYELEDEDDEEDQAETAVADDASEKDQSAQSSDDSDEELERRKEEIAISREAAGKSVDDEQEDPGENDELCSDGKSVELSLRDQILDPDIDYARGEGRMVTDSSTGEESSEEEEDPSVTIEHTWGELDAEAERTDESTRRLAVCNMDWDRIRAVDLMVLFSSFLPPGGSVLSIKIYPSEFGKKRLAEEELHGPPELKGLGKKVNPSSSDGDTSDSDDDEDLVKEQDSDAAEGDEYHMEKLREYQLNRLRYYYAVIECDSAATADKLYAECDGIEYESSATRLDLRFIPDDTSFEEDQPSDVCNEMPEVNSYKPRQFTTTALQQAKVDLTWDETTLERRELGDRLASGKLEDVNERELRQIVAFSSEEDNDDESVSGSEADDEQEDHKVNSVDKSDHSVDEPETKSKANKKEEYINKYRALLAEISEKESEGKNKEFQMEFSWDISEKADGKDDKDIGADDKPKASLTPIERVLQKRNEKNKKRKEERKKKKMLAGGLDPDAGMQSSDDSDFIPDGIDMNDSYFAEEFADGSFAKPKSKQNSKKHQQKKQGNNDVKDEEEERKTKELQLLLDSDDEGQEDKQHFSLDKILKSEQETKSKRKRRKLLKKSKSAIAEGSKEVEDNFVLNVEDKRFSSIYTSPQFNIDPTDPHFKKTKGMERIIHEKLKRRHDDHSANQQNNSMEESESVQKRPKKQLEQSLLIKNLKRKIQLKNSK